MSNGKPAIGSNAQLRLPCLLAPLLAVMLAGTAALAQGPAAHEVTAGGLSATLLLPEGGARVPAVLIIAGSGPVDRDGNVPGARNDSLKLLAEALADQGIATLRADKRGVGRSGAKVREQDLRFDTYVADALSWLDLLRAERRVSSVALIGHSEGALVATLAAQRAPVAGLVLIAGAGEAAPRVIDRQLAAAGIAPDLRQASAAIAAELTAGRAVADVPAALAALYRPSVQNYLMSWFPLDPALELAKVTAPVLVLQGSTDLQVGIDDARRLAAAKSGAKLSIIPGMNHVLKEAPAERGANLQTYTRPELPLAPGLVPAIVEFLNPSPARSRGGG